MKQLIITIAIMLLSTLSASLAAAPVGYSINSDSGTENADSLYRIDLANGAESRIGTVKSQGETRIDVEGLAFAPNGTLYGVDDSSMTLFSLNTDNAQVQNADEVFISGLPEGGGNDFGLTFACDGNLYLTSIAKGSLYRMDLDGTAHLIGSENSLGVKISALAAYGNPVKLYGLGNGIDAEGNVSTPNLYRINPTNGNASKIGPLGPAVGDYTEAGLAFDGAGQLWAINDRRQLELPSQIMRINTSTGAASDVQLTAEAGFESLAITAPSGCAPVGSGEHAEFTVQKRFADGNDITPVNLNISCNTGLPLEQSLTVQPNDGDFGDFEVTFIVEGFTGGNLDCEIWEDTPGGYTATYDCQAEASCSTGEGSGPCAFQGVGIDEVNLCLIQNYVEPVNIRVSRQLLLENEESGIGETSRISLYCDNVVDGDGEENNGNMHWSWIFEGKNDSHTAKVYPRFDGSTSCWTEEQTSSSAVESENSCADPITVLVGDKTRPCKVISTVFFEGIPTLNQYGLLLFGALMLLTGMVAARRF
jgi:hypothetical protein